MRPIASLPPALALGALIGVGVAFACARGLLEDPGACREVDLRIGDDALRVEVASTPGRRRQGLSGRAALPPGRGMLFPYDPPERPRFVMRDMRFDLDIVWIRHGRIVDLTHDARHGTPPPLRRYEPVVPVDHVLEVPAGTARRSGWAIGDAVEIGR